MAKLPCPEAPEMTLTGFVWCVAICCIIFVLTVLCLYVWPPLAIILTLLCATPMIYLLVAEMWNIHRG